jgi:hypothetical protein
MPLRRLVANQGQIGEAVVPKGEALVHTTDHRKRATNPVLAMNRSPEARIRSHQR